MQVFAGALFGVVYAYYMHLFFAHLAGY